MVRRTYHTRCIKKSAKGTVLTFNVKSHLYSGICNIQPIVQSAGGQEHVTQNFAPPSFTFAALSLHSLPSVLCSFHLCTNLTPFQLSSLHKSPFQFSSPPFLVLLSAQIPLFPSSHLCTNLPPFPVLISAQIYLLSQFSLHSSPRFPSSP